LKRWWKVTTFGEIDAKCRNAETRVASHTSNLCLSIPGIAPFFYRGVVRGKIAERPYEGPDRPDAPWLTAKQFASIFVPQGAKEPYAALSVEDSWRFDFRKRAVDQAILKVEEINAILNLEVNCYALESDGPQPRIDQLTLFDDAPECASDITEELF
jgi:hypothetical protein